jgi:hypothetical protein
MIKFDKYNRHAFCYSSLPKWLQRRIKDALWHGSRGLQYWARSLGKWQDAGSKYTPANDGIYRFTPPKKVFVHVHGGVAYVDRVPKGVVVKIIDHDNQGG